MLTPQELQEKKFTKAVFGGYDMHEVDDFLDAVWTDYERLYKEAAVLKGKLKTLADKMNEYRDSYDEMQHTFAEAKRTAEGIVSSAREESDKLMRETRERCEAMERKAREESERQISGIAGAVKMEELKLERAKEQSRAYVRSSEQLLRTQIAALHALEKDSKPAAAEPEKKPAEEKSDTKPFDLEAPQVVSRKVTPYNVVDDEDSAADAAPAKPAEKQPSAAEPSGDMENTKLFGTVHEVNIGGRSVKVFDTTSGKPQSFFDDKE